MIDGEASRWAGTDFSLPLRYHGHQLDWTRYMLVRERDILCSGVYSCIFLSMFRYYIDTPWIYAFCERWSYSTNTLLIDDQELTPTLWEIRQLTGLPMFDRYYDEFLLSKGDLRDSSLHPASLREIYRIYNQLRGNTFLSHSDSGFLISPIDCILIPSALLPLATLSALGALIFIAMCSLSRKTLCGHMTLAGRLI
jgi:hypothetical protein